MTSTELFADRKLPFEALGDIVPELKGEMLKFISPLGGFISGTLKSTYCPVLL